MGKGQVKCFKWDRKDGDYFAFVSAIGDVYVKLGFYVQNAYMNEGSCIELCAKIALLLDALHEAVQVGYSDPALYEAAFPVLRKFLEGDYPYPDYDFDLEALRRFKMDLQALVRRLTFLAENINLRVNEKIEKSLNVPSDVPQDELPF
jgi:hypothetical protein